MRSRHAILLALFCALFPKCSVADPSELREVVIAPKAGRTASNIGAVCQAPEVRMESATVDIHAGKRRIWFGRSLPVRVEGSFRLVNESSDRREVTVAFPVSNSKYSAFKLRDFRVRTNNQSKAVFNRIISHPDGLEHKKVSGPDASTENLPDLLAWRMHERIWRKHELPGAYQWGHIGEYPNLDRLDIHRFHDSLCQNMMVWKEVFAPNETRTIDVQYRIRVPLQKNRVSTERIPDEWGDALKKEANNCPPEFLKRIPEYEKCYFFDYYLVSGASWKGAIGEETVRLHLGDSHPRQKAYFSQNDRFVREDSSTWVYKLSDEEPTENLYFALTPRPEKGLIGFGVFLAVVGFIAILQKAQTDAERSS